MNKRILVRSLLALFLGIVVFSNGSFAMTLLTDEQALKEMLPGTDKIVTETKELTAEQLDAVKKILGGSLIHFQKGSEAKGIKEETKCTFHIGMKGDKKTGVALMDEQPGKWGAVKFIIALDPETGKVKNLAVMSYTEKRGRPIARKNFLDQFVGKSAADNISVQKGIRAISGATISSEAVCFSVKKVLTLYNELFLKK